MEGQVNMANLGQIGNVVSISGGQPISVNGTNLSGLTAVPTVSVQGGGSNVHPVQNVPQFAWINYNDGIGQLVTGQNVQLELAPNNDISRQFNQQVQNQFGGPIQVQLLQAPGTANGQQIIPIQLPQQQIQQQIQHQPQQIIQQVQAATTQNIAGLHLEPGGIKLESNFGIQQQSPEKKNRTKTGSSDRVTCKICKKTVSCAATLRDHMRTHTGERPFKCTECDLSFSQRSNLRMHKRLHTGERPYMCGICGKTFARSSHLPAHMRTHTGEKPYVCNECGHSFITAQQLKNHHRVHTGEKPWKCDFCDAAFTHSSSLSTHKKKHTGLKPFECDKCNKKFFFSSALDKHMKVHTKVRPFKCQNCDNTFKYKESLTVHLDRYCGKQTEKKARAPRKADAKKPGPKPGAGRKYVQQRKGRPRGRPKKKGRWAKKKKPVPKPELDDIEEAVEEPGNPATMEVLETDDHSEGVFHTSLENDEDIPVAELKIETIDGTNEAHVLMDPLNTESVQCVQVEGNDTEMTESNMSVHLRNKIQDSSQKSSNISSINLSTGFLEPQRNNIPGLRQQSQLQQQEHTTSSNSLVLPDELENNHSMLQIDPNASITYMSQEEADRLGSTVQLVSLTPEMMMNGPHQIITAEQLQQLQQQMQQQQGHLQPLHHQQHQQSGMTSQQQQHMIQQQQSHHVVGEGRQQHHHNVMSDNRQQQHHQSLQQQPSSSLSQQQQHHHQHQQQHIMVHHQQQQHREPHNIVITGESTSSMSQQMHTNKDGVQVYYSG